MKKIGILTFHASHNYGSMLQAYALQKYLQSQGLDVEIINFRGDVQRHDMYPYPLEQKGMALLKHLLAPIWLYHRCQQWKKFETFMRENMRLSEKTYKSWEELRGDIGMYDTIITGGDQIWNMDCKDFDKSYFLPEKIEGVRKISYCPSCGNFLHKITKQQQDFMIDCLSDYDAVSVRESYMRDFFAKLLIKDIEVVVDPTLLTVADDYQRLSDSSPLVEGDYILYYTPRYNSEFESTAALIGKHYEMKVITSLPRKFRNSGMRPFYGAGPKEFLNLLKNAKVVIGSSYHLVVFALIFHKEFIVLNGANDDRLSSLLNYLGIVERGLITANNYKSVQLTPIDYENTDMLLSQLRKTSTNFLTKALS